MSGPLVVCIIIIIIISSRSAGSTPSGRTVAGESTRPLTEMSARNTSWWQRRPVRTADNLATFMCRLCGTSESLKLLEAYGPV
jgi:hypothetical protein